MTITLLDGGMGQELVTRAPEPPTGLWATKVLLEHPGLVREVHDAYFAAGAEIATVNSYAIHRDRLERNGIAHEFGRLLSAACEIACAARDAHGSGLVAGALGPLGWSYRPDLHFPVDEAADIFAESAQLQARYVDLLLCETIPSVEQAEGAVKGAARAGKPVWLAVTVNDEDGTRLRSGEPVTDILPLAEKYAVAALLINCSLPEAVTQGIPLLVGHGLPVGAYANGFTGITEGYRAANSTVAALNKRQDLTPIAYAGFARRWADAGATIIGGCCEVGPAHIEKLHKVLKQEGAHA